MWIITLNTDYSFIEVKLIEVEFKAYGENKLETKFSQTDLEEELLMVRKNISMVKDPTKKNKMKSAYKGLDENSPVHCQRVFEENMLPEDQITEKYVKTFLD